MTVIKRDRKSSSGDLVTALESLIPLLEDQEETEACQDLEKALKTLKKSSPDSDEHQSAVGAIIEAFEGDHELSAYTMQRKDSANKWTAAEQLSNASSRVLSLARRMTK